MGKQAIRLQVFMWTIGHSNRSIGTFLELLNEHRIEVLVDVRSFPTSKIEHFRKENMEKRLPDQGTCIMCIETNPKYCHRRFIAAHLERKGVKVIHIIARGQKSLV